jgi:acetoacetyl-CoA reductase/3-oxoacyl-[acyl-carrier protein] reductase
MEQQHPLVIITGGTRGIGLATAKVLAVQGYALELWYQSRKADADKALVLLQQFHVPVRCRQVNIVDRKQVQAALNDAGAIHGLVNNAGILQQKPFATITDDDWDRMIEINLKGAFICSQEVMARMADTGGVIVNVASSGGQLGGMLAVHYAVTKAGIISLTKSLARVGAASGIRSNCVSPGLIVTEMTQGELNSDAGRDKISHHVPMARPGEAEEVADAIAYLLSDRASYITGQTLNVNGGQYMG